MWRFILRTLWRLVIFMIGLGLVYATVRIYRYADDQLPAFVVLLLIYIFFAYIGIPTLIRLLRIFIKPNHIPMYVTTPDGWPADPVNIAIIANSEKHFIDVMTRAGWYTADKSSLRNILREGLSIMLRIPYPNAPFSKLYLFGRPFDIGFQMPRHKNKSAHARHHVRFWRLGIDEPRPEHPHYHFWLKHFSHLLGTDKEVWIGAAIDDTGPLALRWRDGQITHRNDPQTDNERDFIIQTLQDRHLVRQVTDIQAGQPFKFRGQALRNKFICDGSIRAVELKHPLITKLMPSKGRSSF